MKTKFNDWKIDGYTAESPNGKYVLWIANGLLAFKDYQPHFPRETLLTGIGFWKRRRIWKEFCNERNLRAEDFLNSN